MIIPIVFTSHMVFAYRMVLMGPFIGHGLTVSPLGAHQMKKTKQKQKQKTNGSVGVVLPPHHYHFCTKNRPQELLLPIVRDPLLSTEYD